MPLEYRVLWTEIIAGQLVPFSGRVGTFDQTQDEAKLKRSREGYYHVMIEAREKSDQPWSCPWDEELKQDVDTPMGMAALAPAQYASQAFQRGMERAVTEARRAEAEECLRILEHEDYIIQCHKVRQRVELHQEKLDAIRAEAGKEARS